MADIIYVAAAMIRFGVFQLDSDTGELWKSGVRMRLQEQPLRILKLLLERPGEIVTRDQLRQVLWSEQTFVEYDHGLNAAVNKLREVLGDSAANPRFIETIPRRGYRFIAPAQFENDAPGPVSSSPPGYKFRRAWLAGILGLLLVAASLWALRELRLEAPDGALAAVPLTTSRGFELYPRLSPDGTQIAYAGAEDGGAFDIYVKTLGAEQPHRVTSHPANDIQPVWSPDGRSLVFLRELAPGTLQILLTPLLGGPERPLGEFSLDLRQRGMYEPSLDWIGDSQYLVVSQKPGPEELKALFRISVATGEKHRLTFPPHTSLGDRAPSASPDGRTLVFSRVLSGETSELFLLSLTSDVTPAGDPVQLTSLNRKTTDPVWAASGREILFSSGPKHEETLWRILPDRSAQPRPFRTGVERGSQITASRRGGRLAYVRSNWDPNIWSVDLRLPAPSPAKAFIASTRLDHMPCFSPNGERILFNSNRSGLQQVWVSRRDGSQAFQLTSLASQEAGSASWSPDGGSVAFVAGSEGYRHIFLLPSSGGPARRITDDASNHRAPNWSHDGERLYFSSDRSGAWQIWKTAAPGRSGKAVQITRNGGGMSMESPAGDFLYYARSGSSTGVWRVPVNGGRQELVADSLSNEANFWVTRTGLYFIPAPDANGRTTAEFINFSSGLRSTLFAIEKPAAWGLSVSPDQSTLLFTQIDSWDTDLMLIDALEPSPQ